MKGSPFPRPQSGEPVEVAEYDPRWPALFEEERDLIRSAIGEIVVDIQHIGSTAIPGLAAKPIIDIMVGVESLEVPQETLSAMEAIGYEFRGDGDVPGRLYFRKGRPRSHQVHMTEYGSAFWEEHIAFRDFLRAHPEDAEAYEGLKRRVVRQFRNDRIGYNEAKADFIQNILKKATSSDPGSAPC